MWYIKDVWHAKKRIEETLSKSHADYKKANEELIEIFAKLKHKTSYSSTQKLADAFEKWEEKFSICSNIEKLNDKQLVLYLGII